MKKIFLASLFSGLLFAQNVDFSKMSMQEQMLIINSSHGKQKEMLMKEFEKLNKEKQNKSIKNQFQLQMGSMGTHSMKRKGYKIDKADLQKQIQNEMAKQKYKR